MSVCAVTLKWTGFAGAPGYTRLHFTGADATGASPITDVIAEAAANVADDFCAQLANAIPQGASVVRQELVESYDQVTGLLEAEFDTTVGATANGQYPGGFAGPVGGVIHWLTDGIAGGRRVRGRSFIVPMVSRAFDVDGTFTTEGMGWLDAAGLAMIQASDAAIDASFVVWKRPVNGSGGSTHRVTSHRVPDMGAVLRSRRD